MKDYQAKNIRNIAVVGHGSEGKTTLVEALLYATGTIDRQGRVEDGTTVTDSEPEEKRRQISISAAVAPLEWKDVKVNLIDVPGYFDFAGEMVGPMAVAEGAIITVGAVSGLNVGAEKAWALCDKTHTSRMIVINQMDRENANFARALATITDKYGSHIAPIEVPIVEGGKLRRRCVRSGKQGLYRRGQDPQGKLRFPPACRRRRERPRGHYGGRGRRRGRTDGKILRGRRAFAGGDHAPACARASRDGTVVPVVCCSSLTRVGLAKLLDNLIDLMPSPAGTVLRASTPRPATPKSASAKKASPSPRALFKTLADPFVASCRSEGHFRHAFGRYAALQRQRRKGREGRQHLLPARRQAEPGAEGLRGRYLRHFQIEQRRHGNTLCDPGKPVKFEDLEFPAPCISMAVYARRRRGGQDLLRPQPSDGRGPDHPRGKECGDHRERALRPGELHLEVIAKKLASKFGAECLLQFPKIPYRESIRKKIDVQGRHKKQSGGHGQLRGGATCGSEFRPTTTRPIPNSTLRTRVVGGVVPRNFIPRSKRACATTSSTACWPATPWWA